MKSDVVILGAGPVGLMLAVATKLRRPKTEITLVEKYPEYTRKHVLHVEANSLKDMPTTPEFQEIINTFPGFVKTTHIEQSLKRYAKQLGINILYQEIKHANELQKLFPETKYFVDASGSHGRIRQDVFNDEKQINNTVQYIIELKYEVQGKAKKLSSLPATLSKVYDPKVIHEAVGRYDEQADRTPVSLRLFVDKEIYDEMGEVSFKQPKYLTDLDNLSFDVRQSLKNHLSRRALTFNNEKPVKGTDKITKTHLDVYAAKDFIKDQDEVFWILVGDALMGVPYFRSLNAGLIGANILSQSLTAELNHQYLTHPIDKFSKLSKSSVSSFEEPPTEPLAYYKYKMQKLVDSEIFWANFKNVGLDMLHKIHYSSYMSKVAVGKSATESNESAHESHASTLGFMKWLGRVSGISKENKSHDELADRPIQYD